MFVNEIELSCMCFPVLEGESMVIPKVGDFLSRSYSNIPFFLGSVQRFFTFFD